MLPKQCRSSCGKWGIYMRSSDSVFTDPPSGHTTETLAGTNGSTAIGVLLSFRPEGGFEGTGFESRYSRHSPFSGSHPSGPRSKKPPGFFVATNLPRGSLVVSFLFFLSSARKGQSSAQGGVDSNLNRASTSLNARLPNQFFFPLLSCSGFNRDGPYKYVNACDTFSQFSDRNKFTCPRNSKFSASDPRRDNEARP